MRLLAVAALLATPGCAVARAPESTLVENFGSRPLVVAGCFIGTARVFVTLDLNGGLPGQPGDHAILVLEGRDNEIAAWQIFRFVQGGVEVSETSGGLVLDGVLSGWREFLLSRPLHVSRGVEWVRSSPDQRCPAHEDSPWH